MSQPASATGGVKPMAIAGRMVRERERLTGMSADERAWRAKWVKDQHLSPNEPVYVPEYWRARINPIRRLYKAPLDALYKALTPALGNSKAFYVRFWTGKFLMVTTSLYALAYMLKYNPNDWQRKGGWHIISSRKMHYPGDAAYPNGSERTKPSEYASKGFEKSVL